MRPKILIIAASLRAGSHNARLAALAAKELTLAEADVTRISLADYALPIFDADLMADSGLPPPAIELKRMLTAHRGVFIATPEYSASVPPLLKNAIDWMSRGHERGEPSYAAYKGRVFAVGAASPAVGRRPAGADRAAADPGARLRCARHPRTTHHRARRRGVRRDGQSQG